MVGAAVFGVATYFLIRYVDEVDAESIEDGVRRNGQSRENQGWQTAGEEHEEDDDEDDGTILFLPTGLSRPKPTTFYRGSDPEWQEFKKIASDRPRVTRIQVQLVNLIRDIASKNPSYTARLGTIDPKKGKIWIEFQFPYGPPIEYERPGIELTDQLEWRKATRDVETLHHHRLQRLLFPTDVANALYADTKRKAETAWKSLRGYMSGEQKNENGSLQTMSGHAVDASATPPHPGLSASSPQASSPNSQAPVSSNAPPPTHSAAKDPGIAIRQLSSLTLDLKNFQQDLRKSAKPYPSPTPRGIFYVLGLIEIYGERSRITLNVTAVYDPKQGRYVGLSTKIWNLVDHKQSPKGGA